MQSNVMKCFALVCALSMPVAAFAAADNTDATATGNAGPTGTPAPGTTGGTGTGGTGMTSGAKMGSGNSMATPPAGANGQPGPAKPTGLQ